MNVTFGDETRLTPSEKLIQALRSICPSPWASYTLLPRELERHHLRAPELVAECTAGPPAIPCYHVKFLRPVYGRVAALQAALPRFRGRVEWALYESTVEAVPGCPPTHWTLAPRVYRDLELAGTDPRELTQACLDRQPELFWHAEDDVPHLTGFIQILASQLPPPPVH